MNLWEILSAILMIFGLILNALLAISVVRNVGNIQKRLDELEEMNDIWRDSIQSRVESLETWRRKCALARRTQINNGGTQQ